MWSIRAIRERIIGDGGAIRSRNYPRELTSAKIPDLKTLTRPTRNARLSLGMVYTQTILVLHWSKLTPTHSLFPVIILLVLTRAGCICEQYAPDSSQVKVIFYISIFTNPSARAGYDTRSIFKRVWIQSFPSPRLVVSPRLKNLVCPTIYP